MSEPDRRETVNVIEIERGGDPEADQEKETVGGGQEGKLLKIFSIYFKLFSEQYENCIKKILRWYFFLYLK